MIREFGEFLPNYYKSKKEKSLPKLYHQKPNFNDLKKLSWKMWDRCKAIFPSYIMFPIGLKQMSENYYKIVFEFKGYGVEAPSSMRAEQFNIDIHFNKKTGIIKVWGYNIDSDIGQHTWKVQISDFNEWFAPSQPIEEIVKAVHNSLMTY